MSMSPVSGTHALYPQPNPVWQMPPPMSNTAQLLGLSTDELQKDQQSGTTLADLASQKGISKDDLVKSITADLKANAPQGAPALSDAQLTQMATSIADGKRPHGGGHHHHHHVAATSDSGDSSQNNLSSLASVLGIDPNTLVDQLSSGQSLSSLLSQSNASQSSADQSSGSQSGSASGSASTAGYDSTGSSSFAGLVDGGIAVDQHA